LCFSSTLPTSERGEVLLEATGWHVSRLDGFSDSLYAIYASLGDDKYIALFSIM